MFVSSINLFVSERNKSFSRSPKKEKKTKKGVAVAFAGNGPTLVVTSAGPRPKQCLHLLRPPPPLSSPCHPDPKSPSPTSTAPPPFARSRPADRLPPPPSLLPRSRLILEVCPSMAASKEQAVKDYADFMDKVKKTIYIDQLSHQVTSQVIKAALSQCANVVNVEFIVNYTIPYDIPSAALVELEDEAQAKAAVELMNDFPFIIGGMPRPVKATYAKPEMFRDRPPRPGIKKDFRWVKKGDDEYEGMKKLKNLAKRQEVENMVVIKNQLEEEKELAKRQQEILDGNGKKYDMLETVMQNGARNLAHRYGVNLDD